MKKILIFSITMLLSSNIYSSTLEDVIEGAKVFAGPIAYGVSNQVLTKNFADDDWRATVDASFGMLANSIKNEYNKDKKYKAEEETSKKIMAVCKEAAKPWLVLGTIKYGLPFLNAVFNRLGVPQMAGSDKVTAKTAQKIVLFYVGLTTLINEQLKRRNLIN